jgi:hypothetical protein
VKTLILGNEFFYTVVLILHKQPANKVAIPDQKEKESHVIRNKCSPYVVKSYLTTSGNQ